MLAAALFLLVPLPALVVEGVGSEHHVVAILDDGLAAREDPESALVGVVYSKLVAVEFKVAVPAVVHEDRRLGQRSPHAAVL